MLTKKAIVVLIGNNGTILSKHDKNGITSEFVENFSEENKAKIDGFFKKSESYLVHILLDTIDQTYKKKTYPVMRSYDLDRIAKRDLSSDTTRTLTLLSVHSQTAVEILPPNVCLAINEFNVDFCICNSLIKV